MPTVNRPNERRHAPCLDHVRAADAIHAGVVTCAAETPLRDVARTLVDHHIHCVAVAGVEGTRVSSWAIMSDRDAGGGGVDERTAGDVAASEAPAISDDDVPDRAVQLMSEHQVAPLVVAGAANGRPVGVLSTLDVAGLPAWHENG